MIIVSDKNVIFGNLKRFLKTMNVVEKAQVLK